VSAKGKAAYSTSIMHHNDGSSCIKIDQAGGAGPWSDVVRVQIDAKVEGARFGHERASAEEVLKKVCWV